MASTALEQFPRDKELLFRRATIYQDLGRHLQALADYEELLKEAQERVFMSTDPSITGYKTLFNMASALIGLGRHLEAVEKLRMVVESRPDYSPAWLTLVHCLLRLGMIQEASEIARALRKHAIRGTWLIVEALVREAEDRLPDALALIHANGVEMLEDIAELDEAARLLVKGESYALAIDALRKLRDAMSPNAVVLHNLGAALLATNQIEESVASLNASLAQDPSRIETIYLLSEAYRTLGDIPSAIALLMEALQSQPDNPRLTGALKSILADEQSTSLSKSG